MSSKTKTTNKNYKPKGKKPYQLWVEEHKNEILELPQKDKVDYVFQKMNEELKTNMSLKSVYQLLYRNDLIEHKKTTKVITTKAEKNNEDIEIINPKSVIDSIIVNNTNDKINEYKKFDVPNFKSKNSEIKPLTDHISPAIEFTTEHLIHYLGQTSLIMCCLIPNIENIEEEFKPTVLRFIETLMNLNSQLDDLKELNEEMKKIDLSRCEEVVVKFLKNGEVDTHLSKYDSVNDLTKIYSLSK